MFNIGIFGATITSIGFGVLFVISLYFWSLPFVKSLPALQKIPLQDRDHASVIKLRFCSILFTCLVCTAFLSYLWIPQLDVSMWNAIGIKFEGLVAASLLPLLLTMILFLGPLALIYFDREIFYDTLDLENSWMIWRNFIVAPFAEEYVFRGCMVPLLISGGYSVFGAAITSPLIFGAAHFHHIVLHLHKRGAKLKAALFQAVFQIVYTSIFGAYCVFLFSRTGHLIAPFLVHAFCNFMGFPRFDLITEFEDKKVSYIVGGCFIIGFIMFWILLFPITEPTLYKMV